MHTWIDPLSVKLAVVGERAEDYDLSAPMMAVTTRRNNIICVRRLRQITALGATFRIGCFPERSNSYAKRWQGHEVLSRRIYLNLTFAAGNKPQGSTTYQT
ncbi:MAG TPA: hypothetical protein VFV58_05230 [Blastocatellia bacterium]|nr:hypothetical protein [Blastocatellia bacterium]